MSPERASRTLPRTSGHSRVALVDSDADAARVRDTIMMAQVPRASGHSHSRAASTTLGGPAERTRREQRRAFDVRTRLWQPGARPTTMLTQADARLAVTTSSTSSGGSGLRLRLVTVPLAAPERSGRRASGASESGAKSQSQSQT